MEIRINTIDRVISKDGLADICTVIHYTLYKEKTVGSGDDAVTYSSSTYGTVGLDSPDADNFTAYADITEAKAKDWCEAKLKEEDVKESKYEDGDDIPEGKKVGDVKVKAYDKLASIESSLDAQIAEQETPTKSKGVPW
jgi:hypothetical protein